MLYACFRCGWLHAWVYQRFGVIFRLSKDWLCMLMWWWCFTPSLWNLCVHVLGGLVGMWQLLYDRYIMSWLSSFEAKVELPFFFIISTYMCSSVLENLFFFSVFLYHAYLLALGPLTIIKLCLRCGWPDGRAIIIIMHCVMQLLVY